MKIRTSQNGQMYHCIFYVKSKSSASIIVRCPLIMDECIRLCFPRFDLLQPFLLCIRDGSGKIAVATGTSGILGNVLRFQYVDIGICTTTSFFLIPVL